MLTTALLLKIKLDHNCFLNLQNGKKNAKKFRYLLLLSYLQMHLEALTTCLILRADLHKSILSNEEPSWYKSLPNAFHSHL